MLYVQIDDGGYKFSSNRPPLYFHSATVVVVLYQLGSCGEYRVRANQFGVHKCTVKKFVYMVCKGMLSYAKNLIQVPSLEEANAIAYRFEMEHHIPQIIGCVGGTHIPILPPKDGYRDFVIVKDGPHTCFRQSWMTNIAFGVSIAKFLGVHMMSMYCGNHSYAKRPIYSPGE
ncbi:uncharacterized protein LOC124627537 [Ictalurus punctatus]|uniref:Uncharacterized protein LOC124627537 n=1 Tax=Ictalurus punctatus TaxID=7998 RepID=A0A979ERC5_ICTPU|nr:uncharacterized protein LOC124627537 [Ictalurus punctatus]